jgi:excisionase family DNA binding protein
MSAIREFVDPTDQLRADLSAMSEAAALINERMPRVLGSLLSMVRDVQSERALPVLVDLTEAARLLGGVSTRTVRRMVDRGEIESVSVTGRRMVFRESIERVGASPTSTEMNIGRIGGRKEKCQRGSR